MVLQASDRFLIKEFYRHPRKLNKNEKALVKDLIQQVLMCAINDIQIINK